VRLLATVEVARFDLRTSLRSRRAIGLLLLYLVSALGGTVVFLKLLQEAQRAVPGAGALVTSLKGSEQLVRLLAGLTGSRESALALIDLPAISLFYGWFALSFVPLLVTLTSYDCIAGHVGDGSIRFSLQRCSRLDWAVGKLVGQALLLAAGVATGALATFFVYLVMRSGGPLGGAALWIARFAGRALCYGFAYLGLTLLASQLTRTPNGARTVALLLLALVALGARGGVYLLGRHLPDVAGLVKTIFPWAHGSALWRVEAAERIPAMLALLVIGAAYFALGYLVLRRRDA